MRVRPGAPSPLGATFDGAGVNFALFSAHAATVELCLFDHAEARTERVRVSLVERTDLVWHVYVPGLQPGQLYGYRVSGPWDPQNGHRFNPAKVVLDPYARRLGRSLRWSPALLGSTASDEVVGCPDPADSAPFAPLAVVPHGIGATPFDWQGDTPLRTPWHETLIYELHVKGFSALNDSVPASLRGTYLGLASDPSIRHLLDLGVTAVELMPVHVRGTERRLVEAGLVNYWGYNTLAFFAPDERFATNEALDRAGDEFKVMVRTLHEAGLEVILDVVYNHTAEGDESGPTVSFRGIDNRSYYRLDPDRPGHYENFAGTGNVLDLRSPRVLQLVMDSLRYWVEEMHVDGFRFDLASVLTRESDAADPQSGFCRAILQDPVLSTVKLIAEPWDATSDGYQVGRFPPGWSEWNDRYRNAVRRFWSGERGTVPELSTRIAGSSDVYAASGRHPTAGLNTVTTHDGFTLADLVAYNDRHNDANGEQNTDGERNNLSWNSGVEGPTSDPAILALRERRRRNLLLTLMMSLGAPMISGGDEVGRSQRGNNNAYCHDSPLSWTPWNLDTDAQAFLAFVKSMTALRASQPALRRRRFLNGRMGSTADVRWLRSDGQDLTGADWSNPDLRVLGVLLDGDAIVERDAANEVVRGDTLLVILSADPTSVRFALPNHGSGGAWQELVDTAAATPSVDLLPAGSIVTLIPHSAKVFRLGA